MTTIDGVRSRSIDETRGTEPSLTSARAAAGASLMPTPEQLVGDDPGAQIEALVLSMARDDAQAARTTRDQQEALARSAEAAQVDAMARRVDAEYVAGVVGGFASVGAGAVGLIGGESPRAQAASKVVEGSGKLMGTEYSALAGHHGVEETHQRQLAERFERSAGDARDQVKAARETAERAVSFFKEYVAARAEAQKAALFRA